VIDNFSVMVSTVMCVFVVYRAIKLDAVIPWFGKKEPSKNRKKNL
jgi:hypothetical protein